MDKLDLSFTPPLLNAAGSLGFAPDIHGEVDWSRLGAFVTNPISLNRRTPAHGPRFIEYPGGFLLHTGFPNPGLAQVLRHHARHWSRSPVPVVVHLLGSRSDEIARMARRLENVEGVSGLEVGFAADTSPEAMVALIQAACGELPVIAQLPIERCMVLAVGAIQAGATLVSLAAPRGILPAQAGELVQGRLYGPSVLPMALKVVRELTQQGVPTIGAGGVYTQNDITAMRTAGASAVQLDAVLWRGAGYKLVT
jgi:dihydroorotate dehydrogenase (NAD+) catalytic subunit